MKVIQARNVREAYYLGINHLLDVGKKEQSRAGEVMVAPYPVTTVYEHPTERVLIDPRRDANPVFHMAEAMWMLAGRQDAAFLNKYVRNFGERFAEEAGDIHDAYGFRWRKHLGYDQLNHIINTLRKDPSSRQCVLQMWDAAPAESYENNATFGESSDLIREGANDLCGSWRTRPCNTHVYFRTRPGVDLDPGERSGVYHLDMTICCRSNDMIMGGYGANAVHFSIMQEYVAARAGMCVGQMYQVSNNFHAYVADLERVGVPELPAIEYESDPLPLINDPSSFDQELVRVMQWADSGHDAKVLTPDWAFTMHNTWLGRVAVPLFQSYAWGRKYGFGGSCLKIASECQDPDWRRAAMEWLQRRYANKLARESHDVRQK